MKGFIYIIRSKSSPLVYYGSTTQKLLSNRMSSHRTNYKQWLAGKCNNCTSYQILALGDAYIELVEEVEIETKQHLYALEGKYQRENDCVNHKVAGRTKAEWRALPEIKAKTAAYRVTYAETPKAKATAAAYRASPDYNVHQAAYRATPASKAYHAAYMVAYRANPERKAAEAARTKAYRLKKKAAN